MEKRRGGKGRKQQETNEFMGVGAGRRSIRLLGIMVREDEGWVHWG